MVVLAFQIVALILLVLAALSFPPTPRVSLGWLGLAFFVLSFVWQGLKL